MIVCHSIAFPPTCSKISHPFFFHFDSSSAPHVQPKRFIVKEAVVTPGPWPYNTGLTTPGLHQRFRCSFAMGLRTLVTMLDFFLGLVCSHCGPKLLKVAPPPAPTFFPTKGFSERDPKHILHNYLPADAVLWYTLVNFFCFLDFSSLKFSNDPHGGITVMLFLNVRNPISSVFFTRR